MSRSQQISLQIMRREQGLSDEAYRNILFKATGKRSSKDLDTRDYDAVFTAMGRAMGASKPLKDIVIKPRDFHFRTIAEPRAWNYVTPTEEQWNDLGNLIARYDRAGIIVVAIWDAYGKKTFKWRYK